MFDVEKITADCVRWIRTFFEENGKGCNAVIGISGGKDSSIAAALCVEALGKERVIGVLMPQGEQHDIDMAYMLVNHLGMPDKCAVKLVELCRKIKEYGFNLRLSVNMTDYFNKYAKNEVRFFEDAKRMFNPDQMTIRLLYKTGDGSEQSNWVEQHACDEEIAKSIVDSVRENAIQLERLPYGRIKYSYMGMSLVVDDDCMSKTAVEDYKYLILQPNCRLYSRWDDTASLIF